MVSLGAGRKEIRPAGTCGTSPGASPQAAGASRRSIEDIRRFLEVDSLHYLELGRMLKAAGGGDPAGFCAACFTGQYPTPILDYERTATKSSSRTASAPVRGGRELEPR